MKFNQQDVYVCMFDCLYVCMFMAGVMQSAESQVCKVSWGSENTALQYKFYASISGV